MGRSSRSSAPSASSASIVALTNVLPMLAASMRDDGVIGSVFSRSAWPVATTSTVPSASTQAPPLRSSCSSTWRPERLRYSGWWALPLSGIVIALVGTGLGAVAFAGQLPEKRDLLPVAGPQDRHFTLDRSEFRSRCADRRMPGKAEVVVGAKAEDRSASNSKPANWRS